MKITAKQFTALILTILIPCALVGCSGKLGDSLNKAEFLTTEQVVQLLNENGLSLEVSSDFPLELDTVKKEDFTPSSYKNTTTGVFYLIYETDNYAPPVKDYSYNDDKSGMLRNMFGKNIWIYEWSPEMYEFVQNPQDSSDTQFLSKAEEEWKILETTLTEKAFDGKHMTFTGQSENWTAQMDFNFYENILWAKDGIKVLGQVSGSNSPLRLNYVNESTSRSDVIRIKYGNTKSSSEHTSDEDILKTYVQEDGSFLFENFSDVIPSEEMTFTVEIDQSNGTKDIIELHINQEGSK